MKPQTKTISGPIKREIQDGDLYVDLPVMESVEVFCGKEPMHGEIAKYFVRQPLRWVKPDGSPQ